MPLSSFRGKVMKNKVHIGGHLSTISDPPAIPERFRICKSKDVLERLAQWVPLTWDTNAEKSGDEIEALLYRKDGTRIYTCLTGLLPLWGAAWSPEEVSREFQREIQALPIPDGFRDYQRNAAEVALQKRRCTIEIATGGGKSWLAWYWVSSAVASGGRAIITVPTINLLYQMKADLLSCVESMGDTNLNVALLGGGENQVDISSNVIIAIPDTLWSRRDDPCTTNLLKGALLWIGDEQHKLCNPTGASISYMLREVRYRIGMTATRLPASKGGRLLEGLFGLTAIKVEAQRLIGDNVILQPEIHIYESPIKGALGRLMKATPSQLGGYSPQSLLRGNYSHSKYQRLYEWLIVRNEERNALIAKIALNYMDELENEGYPMLIILQRVDTEPTHTGFLLPHLGDRYKLPILTGKTKRAEIQSNLDLLREGKLKGAIVGPSLLQEGTNIPCLGSVIIATGGRSSIGLIQRVGRAVRYMEGKRRPTIYDFYDPFSYFASQSDERISTYARTYGEDSIKRIPGGEE
jgi:superfamily II DNA or RNA helicase